MKKLSLSVFVYFLGICSAPQTLLNAAAAPKEILTLHRAQSSKGKPVLVKKSKDDDQKYAIEEQDIRNKVFSEILTEEERFLTQLLERPFDFQQQTKSKDHKKNYSIE